MRRHLTALILAGLALGPAAAQGGPDAASAQREAEAARIRSERLERAAGKASSEAQRANAQAAALAGRIEAAEAEITAAQARILQIEALRRDQRARLAAQQGPLIRLTAALQTMARRPAALALVQPGSLDDAVHVRALLASSLPAIRKRTAAVRVEVDRGKALRREADEAIVRLRAGQEDLNRRRFALARFEQAQRQRSRSLAESAVLESDRALAFGEEARELTALAGTRQFQVQLERRLARLPGALPRPGEAPPPPPPAARYILPVDGRLLAGTGEISDSGVHARGLSFATRAGAEVVAPRSGRVVYLRRFGGYGLVAIVDHGGGWTSTLTHLSAADVAEGASVRQGQRLGRAGETFGVELRLNARPVPIALFL